jgi:uncharacterized damage-inducible protein DinB
MSKSVLTDALGHHVWATLQVLDACRSLSPQQLGTAVPGTYGSILDTLRHLVGSDASYLFVLTGGRIPEIEEERMDLPQLRAAMEGNGPSWASFVAQDLDMDSIVVRHRDDGSESHAPMSIRLAQVVHHGTDHRSQICTALTTLGLTPPEIDVWDFAAQDGRLSETPPSA